MTNDFILLHMSTQVHCFELFITLILHLSMVCIRSRDVRLCRVAVNRPIPRSNVLVLFDNYSASFCEFLGCSSSSCISVDVLDKSIVSQLFGSDQRSLASFRRVGGVLLRSTLASKFLSKRDVLFDLSIWHFWDVVVMQSGWSLLDISELNAFLSCSDFIYLGLVRFLPSQLCAERCASVHSTCTSLMCTIRCERLFSVDVAYGLCSDISLLLSQKAFEIMSDAGSADKFISREVGQLKYQLVLLDQMIKCKRPISQLFMFCMEINALLLFKRTLLHCDFDVFNFSHMSDLLADEVSSVVLLKLYSLKFDQLSADVVVY